MNLIDFLISPEFTRAFAWTLLHSLWQGGLLALITAGLLMILRKHRPGVRYTILYIMMLLLPAFFIGTFLMIYNPAHIGTHPFAQTSGALWQPGASLAGNLKSIPVNEIPQAWYTYLVHLFENQAKWLVLLWFTGFSVFLLRFSGSFIYVYRLRNHKVYPVGERWNANLSDLSGKIGMHRTVRLVESALARIPMTIGYLKPVILLPLGTLSGVPPQQIDAILLHELAHILRKDYLLNIIQSVVELMFFYHPVTWWLSGLIRQEREHICDDLAVAVNQDHINYIKALTTMEELNSKSPLLASAMMGPRKKLLIRVKRLLSPVILRRGFSEGIIAFILLTGLIFTLSLNALSIMPNAYDLTGRESGEKVYKLLALDNNKFQPVAAAGMLSSWAEPPISKVLTPPDTVVARSKSGKVVISVYSDSTSQLQQEQLNRMVENLDKQVEKNNKNVEEYEIQVRKFGDGPGKVEKERKIVIIGGPDSTMTSNDSVTVIYNGHMMPHPGHRFEYKFDQPGCGDSSRTYGFNYFYSIPDMPDLENLDRQLFAFQSDSLDTLIFKGPGGEWFLNNKDFELSSKEWQQRMEELGRDLEKQQRDAERHQRDIEKFYHDNPGDLRAPEPSPYFYSVPPAPPLDHNWNEHNPGPRITPSEKIIRQELIDDGLAAPNKKYVIDLNSKGMYINGEKQLKEIYRKYKHLVESLDLANLIGDDTYRLIF
jgi:bla regulator protein blaR1